MKAGVGRQRAHSAGFEFLQVRCGSSEQKGGRAGARAARGTRRGGMKSSELWEPGVGLPSAPLGL